jgi:transposase, IS5 family
MSRKLFGEEERLDRLTQLKDPLIEIKARTDWKVFEKSLNRLFPEKKQELGGRPSYNKLLLFKILILQEYCGLSDKAVEFHISDRLSFMRFLDLTLDDTVPDSNTVWNFREELKKNNAIEQLFDAFVQSLRRSGIVVNKGSIIDATIVKAPIQRNSRSENDQIKKGDKPEDWSEKKSSHKDTDANWTAKHGKQYFGYKNHIKADMKSKIVTKCYTTQASTSDTKGFVPLLEDDDIGKTMHMDSGYDYQSVKAVLEAGRIKYKIQARPLNNKPLTEEQKNQNHKMASYRCRVEHVFGVMHTIFGPALIRTIGFERAKVKNLLRTLTYNIKRASFLMGYLCPIM